MATGQRRFISIQPLEKWPDKTRSGASSQFRASFTDTLDFLERELEHLNAVEPTIQTLHSPDDVRVDGRLKTDTRRPSYQGVILTFKRAARQHEYACPRCREGAGRFWATSADKSKSGYAHKVGEKSLWCDDQKPKPVEFRFPADRYADWKDNVRAIAMVLEGLRMIERHGVKSEAQYTGYKALPPADEKSDAAAAEALQTLAAATNKRLAVDVKLYTPEMIESLYREAANKTHPDKGGTNEEFVRVSHAARVLRERVKANAA